MDDSAKGWLYKTARSNHWRVQSWIDLDDLIQDGFMLWGVIRRRYPEATDIKHVMRLFQTTFTNHIHLLARHKRDRPEITDDTLESVASVSCPDSEMAMFIAEAPDELRPVLSSILADPAVLNRPARRYLGGRRETTNEWLAGIASQKSDKDLSEVLLAYLTP
jgi:hypothetical protein